MSSLRLIRSVAAPFAADPDWAGAQSDPGFSGLVIPPERRSVYFAFRGIDATGGEVALTGVELGLALVVRYRVQGLSGAQALRLAEFAPATVPANGMAQEVDLPGHAVEVFPRISTAVSGAPGALATLQILAGVWGVGQ